MFASDAFRGPLISRSALIVLILLAAVGSLAGASSAGAKPLPLTNDIPPGGPQTRATGDAASAFVPGDGFAVLNPSWVDRSNYTLRLVSSGNVEAFRSTVQAAVNDLGAGGVQIYVAPGTIPAREPEPGEILLSNSENPECKGAAGCARPVVTEPGTGGKSFITASRIWIHAVVNNYSAAEKLHVVEHELGHALGLDHYSSLYNGQYQLMHPSSYDASSYRSGDRNGLSYMYPTLAPEAETKGVYDTKEGQVTLEGSVNANGRQTTYRFEYGPTALYGSLTPVESAGIRGISIPVSTIVNLDPGGPYHYRIVATSVHGTVYGADREVMPPESGSKWALASGGTLTNPNQWVYHRSTSEQIWQWNWFGSEWKHPQATTLAAEAGTSPTALAYGGTSGNPNQAVYYHGSNDRINQWFWNGSSTSNGSLPVGEPIADSTSPTALASGGTPGNPNQWIYYQGEKVRSGSGTGSAAYGKTLRPRRWPPNPVPVQRRSPTAEPRATPTRSSTTTAPKIGSISGSGTGRNRATVPFPSSAKKSRTKPAPPHSPPGERPAIPTNGSTTRAKVVRSGSGAGSAKNGKTLRPPPKPPRPARARR